MGATILSLPSTVTTTSGNTDPLQTGPLYTLAVDVNVTAASGTSPTLALFVDRLGADGNWYAIWSPTAVTAAGTLSTSIGPGCAVAEVPTDNIRLRWVLGGTTPSFTFSASIIAR